MAEDYSSFDQSIADSRDALQSSPSAYDPSMPASYSDLAAQRRLVGTQDALNKAASAAAKARWSPSAPAATDVVAPPDAKPGLLQRSLAALQAPTKALVGVAKYATGKAEPGKGFFETVGQNMGAKGETFGGLLESHGVAHPIAATVGFGMDLAFDPINIATMGAGTLIGRTGIGAMKAGIKGAELGAKSRGLELASKVLSHVPGLKTGVADVERVAAAKATMLGKDVAETAVAKAEGFLSPSIRAKAAVSMLGDRAVAASKEFSAVTGYDVMKELDQVVEHGAWGVKPSEALEKYIVKVFPKSGAAFIKYTKASSGDWDKMQKAQGIIKGVRNALGFELKNGAYVAMDADIEKAAEGMAAFAQKERAFAHQTGSAADALVLEKRLQNVETVHPDPTELGLGDDAESLARQTQNIPPEGRAIVAGYSEVADSASALMRNGTIVKPKNDEEVLMMFEKAGMEGEQVDFLRSTMAKMKEGGATGFEPYDQAMTRIHNKVQALIGPKATAVVDKAVAYMDLSTKLFTISKTALNPGTWTANFFTGIVTDGMGGMDVLNPLYHDAQVGARKFFRGIVDKKWLETLRPVLGDLVDIQSGSMGSWIQKSLGMSFDTLSDGALIEKIETAARSQGINLTKEDIIRQISEMAQGIKKEKAAGSLKTSGEMAAELITEKVKNRFKLTPLIEQVGESAGGFGTFRPEDLPNSWFLSEMAHGEFGKLLNSLNKGGKEGNNFKRIAYDVLTKPATWYSTIDQQRKLGTFVHLITNGLPASNLQIANKFSKFGSGGIAGTKVVAGELRYLLTPEAAIGVVNELGTNYAAAPAIVQAMRMIPIVGSPFVAFPYLMTAKVGKTLAFNPAFFNKVAFGMREISGRKSPLEKEALGLNDPSKPSGLAYLNDPSFLRINVSPMHSYYLNMGNFLAYNSLNTLMPSERKYRDTWAGRVSDVIDRSPLFKGPAGQMIVDYMLLPFLATEGEVPQNYFGQPLYPDDATLLQKTGYAARTAIESYMPGVASVAGALTPMMPEAMQQTKFIDKVPLGARYRMLAQATQGRNAQGVISPNASVERGLLSSVGVPLTSVDLTNQATKQ